MLGASCQENPNGGLLAPKSGTERFRARNKENIRGSTELDSASSNSAPVSMPATSRGWHGVDEAVVQDGDGGDAEECAMHGADAAEDAGAAEHDGGDGEEFVAGAGIGFGLAEPSGVDDGARAATRPART